MQIKSTLLSLSFLLLFSGNISAEEKVITINYPPDKSVREFTDASVSVSIPLSLVDRLHIKAENDVESDIIPDSRFECFDVPLVYGINTVEITAFKGNAELDSASINIFRRSDIESSYRKPPAGYKQDRFHFNNHRECAECHELNPKETDKKPVDLTTFSDLTEKDSSAIIRSVSTCYSCHNKITSYPFVHGPASVWSCLSCHNPDSVPRYNIPEGESEICFKCHIEQKKEWLSKKYIHGPVNIGKCALCHSPHSSINEFNLHKPTWELCTSCHADKKSGRHVLGGMYFEKGHPTKDKPDPLRKGKELTCASCHNPHASDYPKLWAMNAQGPFELCLKCHKKYYK